VLIVASLSFIFSESSLSAEMRVTDYKNVCEYFNRTLITLRGRITTSDWDPIECHKSKLLKLNQLSETQL